MENKVLEQLQSDVKYLTGKVKKMSDWIHILEDKVRDLEGNSSSSVCDLLSNSENQVVTEHFTKFKSTNSNKNRANIIFKAKRFINEHKGNGQKQYHFPSMRAFIFYDIDFKVNKNKRTVTGYLIGATTKYAHKKVTVKCRPDEVFNETLGKAIVVGRLLDLDVSEFENAPQPDFPTKGMIIASKENELHKWKIENVRCRDLDLKIVESSLQHSIGNNSYADYSENDTWLIILDDTDAKY